MDKVLYLYKEKMNIPMLMKFTIPEMLISSYVVIHLPDYT